MKNRWKGIKYKDTPFFQRKYGSTIRFKNIMMAAQIATSVVSINAVRLQIGISATVKGVMLAKAIRNEIKRLEAMDSALNKKLGLPDLEDPAWKKAIEKPNKAQR